MTTLRTSINPDTRTVCNRIAHHGWQALHGAGVSAAEFTANTGIGLAGLDDVAGRIGADQHRRFVSYMQHFAGNRDWLDVDQQAWFGDYPQLANVCFNSPTLRAALLRLLELRALIGEFDYLLLRDDGDTLEFDYLSEFAAGNGGLQALANFKTLVLIARAYDAVSPGPGPGRRRCTLQLQGPAPAYAGAIDEFFNTRVRYGQPRNLLRMDAAQLDLPFAAYNPLLAPHLLAQAQAALLQVRSRHSWSARVRQALHSLLAGAVAPDQAANLDRIAAMAGMESGDAAGPAALMPRLCRRLGMAPWTLRRALQLEGTTFRALELEVKDETSRRLLLQSELSLAEISLRLGFASQSAFSRFFKARHTVAPARYRHQGN